MSTVHRHIVTLVIVSLVIVTLVIVTLVIVSRRNGCLSDQQKERRPSAEFAVLQVVLYPDSTHLTSNPSIIGIIFYKLLYPKHWNKFIQYLVSITTNLSHI